MARQEVRNACEGMGAGKGRVDRAPCLRLPSHTRVLVCVCVQKGAHTRPRAHATNIQRYSRRAVFSPDTQPRSKASVGPETVFYER